MNPLKIYYCRVCREEVPWYSTTALQLPGRPAVHIPHPGLGHPLQETWRPGVWPLTVRSAMEGEGCMTKHAKAVEPDTDRAIDEAVERIVEVGRLHSWASTMAERERLLRDRAEALIDACRTHYRWLYSPPGAQ